MFKWEGSSEKLVDLLKMGGMRERLNEGGASERVIDQLNEGGARKLVND